MRKRFVVQCACGNDAVTLVHIEFRYLNCVVRYRCPKCGKEGERAISYDEAFDPGKTGAGA